MQASQKIFIEIVIVTQLLIVPQFVSLYFLVSLLRFRTTRSLSVALLFVITFPLFSFQGAIRIQIRHY